MMKSVSAGRPADGGGAAKTTASGMWGNNRGVSVGFIPGRRVFGPLFLITVCPIFATLTWYTNFHLGGSFSAVADKLLQDDGISSVFSKAFLTPFHPTAMKIIGVYMGVQLLLMRLVPGKTFYGPTTPTGQVPVYNANGVQSFLLSLGLFFLGTYLKLYNGGIVYDYSGYLMSSMNVFALVFCALLYVKGRFAPSTSDSGTTGNIVFDYYWGTELYPRIFGCDVKMFTNCRFGMVFWAVGIISYAFAQYERYGFVADSMLVNVSLQLIYVFKFFLWETGYLRSIDIMHDRAGFYICWGCLVWLPCIYTSHTFYLTTHPIVLGTPLASLIFVLGALSIYINYDSDRQRQNFRATNGKEKIWGKEPNFISASYRTEDGKTNSSLLLCSGWWAISRHFHYVPEILASFFWSVPALFDNFMPYFYVVYLSILLLDRAFRDDARCRSKYGKHWDAYCSRVQWRIIPGLV